MNKSLRSDYLYFVGYFDSVSQISQVQYCSVGLFNGEVFSKVIFLLIEVISKN